MMIRLARALFTLAALAVLGSANPVATPKSVFDLTTEIYGPLDTWLPIKAIDTHPGSIVDGKPVNDSFIVGYQPPQLSAEEQKEKYAQLLDLVRVANNNNNNNNNNNSVGVSTLSKRVDRSWCGVRAARALVPHEQLQLFSQYFCYNRPGTGWWSSWPRLDGSWQPFTTRSGEQQPVWFGGAVQPGFGFASSTCLLAFTDIIFLDCYYPPWSTGGVGEGSLLGYDAVVMPKWFIYADR